MFLLQALFPFFLVASGQPVILDSESTYDLTGTHSIVVTSTLDGNGATIKSNQLFNSDTLFIFVLKGGTIKNLNIIGANGDAHPDKSGYMGGIRVRTTGRIENVHFKNLDKWGIDIRGIRWTLTDTTFIKNCTFQNIKRDGYGYAIWTQYGTSLIENCKFTEGRHFIDGSSEGHKIIVKNCTFDRSYAQAIHLHEYRDGYSGSGLEVSECIFYRNAENFGIHPAFPPDTNRIENNVFWDAISTGFWMKSLGVKVLIFDNGIKVDSIMPYMGWKYHFYRFKATINLTGTGTVYIDDFLEPKVARYFTMDDGKSPKIRYITPAKADRFIGERISGDYSLRIRLLNQSVEVY